MKVTISALLSGYRDGTLEPEEVIHECYRRIAEHAQQPAWISLLSESEALRAVHALPEDRSLPLWGIPFGVKDNIDVAGMETTAGCPAFARPASSSATLVRKLQDAGAILIGKTNLDQFATGLVGTRSPYGECSSVFDDAYISGGSSSGSAVAVALEQVAFALGTDTAGSGRVPAAFNNLIGYKPTRGYLSCAGVIPACRSLDCVSIFAHSAGDAGIVAGVAGGFDPADPYSREERMLPVFSRPVRAGVPSRDTLEFFGDSSAAALFDRAVAQLRWIGATVVEVDVAPFLDAARLLYGGPWVAERLEATGALLQTKPDSLHPVILQILEGAAKWTALDAYRAQAELQLFRRAAAAEWQKMDFLVLPTTGTIYTRRAVREEPIALNSNLGRYTNFVNLLDLSAIAVRAGFRPNGLPFGLQFIAPAWRDLALLDLAERWEAQPSQNISVAVVGAHLRGQPLHRQVLECGGVFDAATRTDACYRLYELAETSPRKPGLVRSTAGSKIEVEVFSMPAEGFGRFVAMVPPPLCIGNIKLEDGVWVKGFLCEPAAIEGAEEITEHGGWLSWLNRGKPGKL